MFIGTTRKKKVKIIYLITTLLKRVKEKKSHDFGADNLSKI